MLGGVYVFNVMYGTHHATCWLGFCCSWCLSVKAQVGLVMGPVFTFPGP